MIDWNLAPEGATAIKMDMSNHLCWVNNKDAYWDVSGEGWSNCTHPLGWQTITTRPTQTKTVKDAVEWSDSKWVHADRDVITYSDEEGFSYSKESYSLDDGEQIVCTYEQFEAYVKEQEGEKWTHVTSLGKCRVVIDKPDNHGCVVVELEDEGYSVFKPESLKPIKPTISERDLLYKIKDMAKGVASDGHFGDTVRGWFDEYDVAKA